MSGVALVTWVGEASGSLAAAAALACAGSAPDRAGLLIDLSERRAPRPALMATGAARKLEERLAAHLPRAPVASRGQICQLALSANPEGFEEAAAALALARDVLGVIHLPPHLLQPVLAEDRVRASAALLRADLQRDRSLTALAVRRLHEQGLCVAVLKGPLAWVPSRRALFGVLPPGATGGLPPRLLARLLEDRAGFGASHTLAATGS